MAQSPSPRIFQLASRIPDLGPGEPRPQLSDEERAFWRRAVDLERRRLVARCHPIPVPVR